MKIVFNTKSLEKGDWTDSYFLHHLLQRFIANYPGHELVILTNRNKKNLFLFGKNANPVITRQPVRHALLRKLWFDFKLPAILKRHKADVFVNIDEYCALTTQVPQCLLLLNPGSIFDPTVTKGAKTKRFVIEFLRKANVIITLSSYFKKELSVCYKIVDDKINVLSVPAAEIFLPVNESEKEAIKRMYTNEKNYFLYYDTTQPGTRVINLLKAFSLFKKRQKSGWKLVLVKRKGINNGSFTKALKTYKYRDDIVIMESPDDKVLVNLTGSAYALLYAAEGSSVDATMINGMKCGIPVIADANPVLEELAGDAALYTNFDDHTDIAEKMMRLYKDEALRNIFVERGLARAVNHSWDEAAAVLWQMIQKACFDSSHAIK